MYLSKSPQEKFELYMKFQSTPYYLWSEMSPAFQKAWTDSWQHDPYIIDNVMKKVLGKASQSLPTVEVPKIRFINRNA